MFCASYKFIRIEDYGIVLWMLEKPPFSCQTLTFLEVKVPGRMKKEAGW
jgi:hypothetical protein